jgi:hypothetical protein
MLPVKSPGKGVRRLVAVLYSHIYHAFMAVCKIAGGLRQPAAPYVFGQRKACDGNEHAREVIG